MQSSSLRQASFDLIGRLVRHIAASLLFVPEAALFIMVLLALLVADRLNALRLKVRPAKPEPTPEALARVMSTVGDVTTRTAGMTPMPMRVFRRNPVTGAVEEIPSFGTTPGSQQ